MLENCDRYSAGVVELVDTPASGAGARKGVEVQVLSPVPNCSSKVKIHSVKIVNSMKYRIAMQMWWNW